MDLLLEAVPASTVDGIGPPSIESDLQLEEMSSLKWEEFTHMIGGRNTLGPY